MRSERQGLVVFAFEQPGVLEAAQQPKRTRR
jgi:hypothetical protein